MKLSFEKLSKYERFNEPCTIAMPFKQGLLNNCSRITIYDGEEPVPSQSRVTGCWPDGSVKWALTNFLADLPGNREKDFEISLKETDNVLPDKPVKVNIDEDGTCMIKTGCLNLELSKPGEVGVFNKVKYKEYTFESENFIGPIFKDEDSKKYYCVRIGENGWKVIEEGPVRVLVQAEGKHYNKENGNLLDFTLWIYAFSNKPWIEMEYQFKNIEESSEKVNIREMKLQYNNSINTKKKDIDKNRFRTTLNVTRIRNAIDSSETGERKQYLIDAEHLLYESMEQIPEVMYGNFWVDWTDKKNVGVSIAMFQSHQNFPKAMSVDRAGMEANIIPYDKNGLNLYRGMAKTHKFMIHFHDPEEDIENINVRSLQFQMPDRPLLEQEIYKNSGVYENVWIKKSIPFFDKKLLNLADIRRKAYGIIHWGDGPDMAYTMQGRGNGKLVWLNSEYDLMRASMLMFMHCGERRMLDYMFTAGQHNVDVDICHLHSNPLRNQGQIVHSAGHITGKVTNSHQWVEGLFDYYHHTGNPSILEAALGVGNNILRNMEKYKSVDIPYESPRELGWALRAMTAMYCETYDSKYKQYANLAVDKFENWYNEYGTFLAPYTDHTLIRIVFMIAVVINGLACYYYRINPEERIENMIVNVMKDTLDNCMTKNGGFYYKELPGLKFEINTAHILEALANTYDITGDSKFIKTGMVTFHNVLDRIVKYIDAKSKHIKEDAVIYETGPSPKAFSSALRPLLMFARAASEEGLI